MNAVQRARTAYSPSRAGTLTERDTEYAVFARITHDLKSASDRGRPGFAALVAALHENRRLWRTLAIDVASPGNALPETLRARILYLAEFTDQHTRKVLNGRDIARPLVEINTAIMRGLRPTPEAAA